MLIVRVNVPNQAELWPSCLKSRMQGPLFPPDREPPPHPRLTAHLLHNLRTPRKPELLENIVNVVLDRRHAQTQLGADLLIGQPVADQRRDLALAPRQRQRGIRFVHAHFPAVQCSKESAGDLRRTGLTTRHDLEE